MKVRDSPHLGRERVHLAREDAGQRSAHDNRPDERKTPDHIREQGRREVGARIARHEPDHGLNDDDREREPREQAGPVTAPLVPPRRERNARRRRDRDARPEIL